MSIELSNITKIYNKGTSAENLVLNDVSLTIERGELVAIKGKSGAGKSTLLHMIGCLDDCTSGSYSVDDIEVTKLSNKEIAKLRNEKFGFILQDFGLINDENVLFNVMLPMMFNKVKMRDMEEIALENLRLFQMEDMQKREVGSLSGGEKQRVAIARALVNNPDYILADEPTGSLDSTNSDILMEELIHLHQIGKTVIIITHDDTVAARCNRIIQIQDGRINNA